MKLPFTKMHALGNDFILIDDRPARLKKIPQLSKSLCSRRFGIGADQLLLLCHSKIADFKMRIFNADGREAEMCGNGIRCLAKYIWDEKLRTQSTACDEPFGRELRVELLSRAKHRTQKRLAIETLAGIIRLQKAGELIKVDMGEPVLDAKKIPVVPILRDRFRVRLKNGRILNHLLKINSKTFKITCVSMGNPHAIIIVKDVHSVPLNHYGPIIENHKLFPKRTNVEFIQILNQSNIKMRVWERGVGETMACGTGASAAGVASALLGLTRRKVTVHLPGGKLLIEWSTKDNYVYMTGPAVKVFEGTINI